MISHDHKCIFIHIQRTAGSSIEKLITGKDWWEINPAEKHITASQAKRLYAEYWDKYFKFSFVRHPVDRVMSCLHHAGHFGLQFDEQGNISFEEYRRRFGPKTIIEFDYRFYRRQDVQRWKHSKGTVYGNILDEKLDFIGKYENLRDDIEFLQNGLGIKSAFPHLERSERPIPKIADSTVAEIHSIYGRDFKRYDYR